MVVRIGERIGEWNVDPVGIGFDERDHVLSSSQSRGPRAPGSISFFRLSRMMSTHLPRPKRSVIFKEMDDGAVLYCPESEVYFGLNPTGVRIWRLLQEPSSDLEALARDLGEAFPDAPAKGIREDLREFLSDLAEAELVAEPAAAT